VYGNRQFEQRNAAFTVTTLAHEQFHQLVDMHGDRSDLSTGLEEGLAQYYGLKAMSRSPLSAAAKKWVWTRFVDPKRPVTAGLLEWARRNAAGDPAAYPVFYQQGATFWAEVDRAVAQASANRHSLDEFVPLLLAAKPAAGGALPEAFVDALRTVAGSRIDTLIAKYVGQPRSIDNAQPSQ
jgi:predicted metalloprotease with PDZ domain